MLKLPEFVGVDTDIMIGIQYLKYYPNTMFSLLNGLSVYESQFVNSNGFRGFVGGPHRIFTEIHKNLGSHTNMSAYISEKTQAYKIGINMESYLNYVL